METGLEHLVTVTESGTIQVRETGLPVPLRDGILGGEVARRVKAIAIWA